MQIFIDFAILNYERERVREGGREEGREEHSFETVSRDSTDITYIQSRRRIEMLQSRSRHAVLLSVN